MADHDILALIHDAYDKRARGPSLLSGVPMGDAAEATGSMIELVFYHDYRCLQSVRQGLKAAVQWKVKAVVNGRPPVTTEIFDLWEFDEAGKVVSLVQFTDTALVARLLA